MDVPDNAPGPDLFVNPPSESLICPIHLGLFEDPVIARCGHTFCRGCIIESLAHNPMCPIDSSALNVDALIPNMAVAGQIGDLLVHCQYGAVQAGDSTSRQLEGCQESIKYRDVREHLAQCPYRPVVCPNSDQCGTLLAKDLEEHQAVCTSVPCPNGRVGCPFRGFLEDVTAHHKLCKFESMKDVLGHSLHQYEELHDVLAQKDSQIAELSQTVRDLSEKLENLASNIENKFCAYDEMLEDLEQGVVENHKKVAEVAEEVATLKERSLQNDDLTKMYPHVYTCKGTISGHTGPIWAIVCTNDMLISGSSDTTIKVWDISTFQCLCTLQGHEGIIHALAICGRFLFSGSSDSTVKVWDLQNNMNNVKTVQAHDNTVCTLASAPERNMLFSGSLKHIKVWDAETLECTQTLTGHNHWVRALAVAGDRMYSGSYNMIKVWDLNDIQCIQTINGHDGSVYSLAVYKSYLISGTYENTVQVWDLNTLQCHQTLTGHIGTVYSVCVNEKEGRMFSGSYDNTIKVWDLETLHCVQTMVRHTSSVDAVVHAKGRLFSGGADNTIKIWQ